MYDGNYYNTCDEDANLIIEKYIHEQMIRSLDHAIGYERIIRKFREDHVLLSDERHELIDQVKDLFPAFFEGNNIPDTMRELYTIIYSKERYIPNLVQEYVLAAAIERLSDDISICEGEDGLLEPIPDREKVVNALAEMFEEECDTSKEKAVESARKEVEGIENLSGIVDAVFYDTDFEFLDTATPEELANSGIDREFGIGATESARKRLQDGELDYLGEVDRTESITIRISRDKSDIDGELPFS